MSAKSSTEVPARWVWIVAVVWTVVALGLGIWVTAATGEWMVLLLAFGLTAPLDVMLIRSRRGAPGSAAGIAAPPT
ncbi:hypothetical protein [Leifsonia sp. A12D58]|uniref:hypothetical protein n=1 Tax=Leifsonia sp. A12D58 TaxID=3397674 RepID=UPI0039E03E31